MLLEVDFLSFFRALTKMSLSRVNERINHGMIWYSTRRRLNLLVVLTEEYVGCIDRGIHHVAIRKGKSHIHIRSRQPVPVKQTTAKAFLGNAPSFYFLLALYHPQVASSLPTLRMGMLCTDADLGTFSRPRCSGIVCIIIRTHGE